jgi:nucleoid-associated protein YgaU
MKKLLIALCVAAMAPVAYGQYAAPAAPAAPKDAATATASADPNALTAQPATEGAKVKSLLGERNCVQETGSHIVRKGTCVNATGQAYGQTAIERTGTYNTGVALERLSPSIQVQPGR